MMGSLNQMLAAKEEALHEARFNVVKLQKAYNDNLDTFTAKMIELGIPEHEMQEMGFVKEKLPVGSTTAPSLSLIARP